MKALDALPAADGHVESIVIGFDFVKVAFQTWHARQVNLIFEGCEQVRDFGCVGMDIAGISHSVPEGGAAAGEGAHAGCPPQYLVEFTASPDGQVVLSLTAVSVKIVDCGPSADINAALYDCAPKEYRGGQPMPEQYR